MFGYVVASIRNKITAVMLVAVVSAVLITSLSSAYHQAYRQFEAKQNEIHGIAAAMSTTIAASIANNDRRQISATLAAIARIPGLTFASAQRRDGTTIFQHGTGVAIRRAQSASNTETQLGPLTAIYLKSYVVESPVVHGGQNIGSLTLIADLSPLRGALRESLWMSLALGLLAATIGIAAAMKLQQSITDPIIKLTNTMQEVRDTGNFTRRAERLSRDETGQMVDTFNAMLTEIGKRDEALLRHRHHLEETVKERTFDLRAAKLAAEQANAAKSDFLATMSHEIRTPMNGMLVMAELLSANQLPPRLQRYADVIVKSGQGLLAIINDILDLSKIEQGKLELESISLDLRRLVDDTMQLFSERAASANLDLAAYVAPDIPSEILADPVRLGQIITNLVNNALKFTQSGGVRIAIEKDNQGSFEPGHVGLRFSVRDTGIGIPADKLTTIFDAFAQADQSTTRQFGGTGIGLSICKRLIAAMHGELSVTSIVGAGSTFSFSATFQCVDAAAPTLKPSIAQSANMSAVIILDEGLTRETLQCTLQDWGIARADTDAGNLQTPPALIFCDVQTLEATTLLLEKWPGTPVVGIGRFAELSSDNLLASGRITRALDWPLSSIDLAALLTDAIEQPDKLLNAPVGIVQPPQTARLTSFADTKILAADDSPINREVLTEVLSRLNVELTSVEDGLAAVAAAKTGQYDLIFMDGSMPLLSGFDATREIRQWEAQNQRAAVPIVALTAHVVGDKGDEWRTAGMTDFVSKPFSLADIEACLNRWLIATAQTGTVLPATIAPSSNHGAAAHPLLDLSVLGTIRQIQAEGDDLVARVAGLYLRHAPTTLLRLAELGPTAPYDEFADLAHALKSMSRNVGAMRVSEITDQIETDARERQTRPSADLISELSRALHQTVDELKSLDELLQVAA